MIAIIIVIAAILFPVFSRAREKARQTVCLSNLKQLGMSWLMYAEDNDESFPLYVSNSRGNRGYCALCPPFAKGQVLNLLQKGLDIVILSGGDLGLISRGWPRRRIGLKLLP